MAIPDYQSLMLPVLAATSNGNETRIPEISDQLAVLFGLTPQEKAELLPSGKQAIFLNRAHWAKTYLAKAGFLESTRRGFFKITPRGLSVLESHPQKIDVEFLSQFEEFREFKERSRESQTGRQSEVQKATQIPESEFVNQERTPDENMRIAHQQIQDALAQDLLDRVRAAKPDFFERLIINLLLSMGYGGSLVDAGRALGGTGDDGVDGLIDQDALGLDRVYIQAKRYAVGNNVGSGVIRDFFGSLDRHKAAKGLFVTTSGFTASAKQTAEYLSKRIVLIDGERLAALMIRHNVGCRVEESFEIKKIDEDFFE